MASVTVRLSSSSLRARLRGMVESLLRIRRRAPRRLRLCESLVLGERRFVAVIEFDQSRFLVGGTASSLVLLARLGNEAGDGAGVDGAARTGIPGDDFMKGEREC